MKKAVMVGVGALVASMVFSGCFVMRTLTYTDDKVDPGQKTDALITLNGQVETEGVERPFFLLLPEGPLRMVKGGRFDTKGAFAGPVSLKPDADLAEVAFEECGIAVLRARQGMGPSLPQTAVRTNAPFDADKPRKIIKAKVPLKVGQDAEGQGGIGFGLITGSWFDDGDRVPEDPEASDDAYVCEQPPYVSTLIVKGPVTNLSLGLEP
jgi:hypothetical protein